MAFFSISGIEIKDMAVALPAHTVNNIDLDSVEYPDRALFIKKTGIESRRVAPLGLCASDLCIAAAERIMSSKGYKSDDFGALVFVTQTPDYLLPGNCTLVQNRLGLPNSIFMLDINQGCAGYVYGLATLASIMQASGIERGLLLVGDTITSLLSETDKSTVPIFSDAGSATVLEKSANGKTSYFNLGGDGKGADAIRVEGGGARNPLKSFMEKNKAFPYLAMKGIDVFNYSFRYVQPNIEELLDLSGQDKNDMDYFIFHQANKILNQGLMRKLGIPPEKTPETLGIYGNTSCASIPVTMTKRLGKELATKPLRLLLSGFGMGFSWGSAILEVSPISCLEILEIDGP